MLNSKKTLTFLVINSFPSITIYGLNLPERPTWCRNEKRTSLINTREKLFGRCVLSDKTWMGLHASIMLFMIIRFYLVLASKHPKQILYPAFNSLPFDICMLIYPPKACHYRRTYITLKTVFCVDYSAAMLNYVLQLCSRKSRPS